MAATTFLKNFAKMCLERNDRVFLMLVFLYTRAHPDKNNNQDFYKEVKQTALQYTKKYKKKDKGKWWFSFRNLKEILNDFKGGEVIKNTWFLSGLVLSNRPIFH